MAGEYQLSVGAESWITAAEDLAGINTVSGVAERLTLIDKTGAIRLQGNAVMEFNLKNLNGIATPYNRSNPGFIKGGLPGGGAREWLVPSTMEIENVTMRILE